MATGMAGPVGTCHAELRAMRVGKLRELLASLRAHRRHVPAEEGRQQEQEQGQEEEEEEERLWTSKQALVDAVVEQMRAQHLLPLPEVGAEEEEQQQQEEREKDVDGGFTRRMRRRERYTAEQRAAQAERHRVAWEQPETLTAESSVLHYMAARALWARQQDAEVWLASALHDGTSAGTRARTVDQRSLASYTTRMLRSRPDRQRRYPDGATCLVTTEDLASCIDSYMREQHQSQQQVRSKGAGAEDAEAAAAKREGGTDRSAPSAAPESLYSAFNHAAKFSQTDYGFVQAWSLWKPFVDFEGARPQVVFNLIHEDLSAMKARSRRKLQALLACMHAVDKFQPKVFGRTAIIADPRDHFQVLASWTELANLSWSVARMMRHHNSSCGTALRQAKFQLLNNFIASPLLTALRECNLAEVTHILGLGPATESGMATRAGASADSDPVAGAEINPPPPAASMAETGATPVQPIPWKDLAFIRQGADAEDDSKHAPMVVPLPSVYALFAFALDAALCTPESYANVLNEKKDIAPADKSSKMAQLRVAEGLSADEVTLADHRATAVLVVEFLWTLLLRHGSAWTDDSSDEGAHGHDKSMPAPPKLARLEWSKGSTPTPPGVDTPQARWPWPIESTVAMRKNEAEEKRQAAPTAATATAATPAPATTVVTPSRPDDSVTSAAVGANASASSFQDWSLRIDALSNDECSQVQERWHGDEGFLTDFVALPQFCFLLHNIRLQLVLAETHRHVAHAKLSAVVLGDDAVPAAGAAHSMSPAAEQQLRRDQEAQRTEAARRRRVQLRNQQQQQQQHAPRASSGNNSSQVGGGGHTPVTPSAAIGRHEAFQERKLASWSPVVGDLWWGLVRLGSQRVLDVVQRDVEGMLYYAPDRIDVVLQLLMSAPAVAYQQRVQQRTAARYSSRMWDEEFFYRRGRGRRFPGPWMFDEFDPHDDDDFFDEDVLAGTGVLESKATVVPVPGVTAAHVVVALSSASLVAKHCADLFDTLAVRQAWTWLVNSRTVCLPIEHHYVNMTAFAEDTLGLAYEAWADDELRELVHELAAFTTRYADTRTSGFDRGDSATPTGPTLLGQLSTGMAWLDVLLAVSHPMQEEYEEAQRERKAKARAEKNGVSREEAKRQRDKAQSDAREAERQRRKRMDKMLANAEADTSDEDEGKDELEPAEQVPEGATGEGIDGTRAAPERDT